MKYIFIKKLSSHTFIKIQLFSVIFFTIYFNAFITNNSLAKNNTIPSHYTRLLMAAKGHKFNQNRIYSFVYYWYSLHDKHAAIQKSYALLDTKHLLMIYPEITVKNKKGFKTWYTGVGKNIKNNIHIIKSIHIKFLPKHKYQLKVVVNWQAINKDGTFINVEATQKWILIDRENPIHPYIQEYKVISFKNIHKD